MTVDVTDVAAGPSNWFERHWWKLLMGLALGGIAVAVLCCGGLVYVVFGSLRSNEVVAMTIDRLADDPAVLAHTGEPISAGWFILGQINWNGESGSAALSIPVHGPDGTAEAQVEATREAGRWRIDQLSVKLECADDSIDVE